MPSTEALIARLHRAQLVRTGATIARSLFVLRIGQSNMYGNDTVNTPTGLTTAYGRAVLREPLQRWSLSADLRSGAVPTARFGNISSAPHMAQRVWELTGRESVHCELSINGTAMVPASDPAPVNGGWWSVGNLATSYVGGIVRASESRSQAQLIEDALETVARNPRFGSFDPVVMLAQGENDAIGIDTGSGVTGAQWAGECSALFDHLKSTYGFSLFLIQRLGRRGVDASAAAANEGPGKGHTIIRAAQDALVAARGDTIFGGTWAAEAGAPFNTLAVDGTGRWVSGASYQGDGVHLDEASQAVAGIEAAHAIAERIEGGAP